MPTIGDPAKPNRDEACAGHGAMWAQSLTMPERGLITRLGGWFAGQNSDTWAKLVLWDGATSAVLGQTATFTATGRPFAAGNVDNYEADLVSPVEVDEGQTLWVGGCCNPSRNIQLTARALTTGHKHKDSTSPPIAMNGGTGGNHGFGDYTIGSYAEYELVSSAWVFVGGIWQRASEVQGYRGATWVDAESVQGRRGAAWVDAE